MSDTPSPPTSENAPRPNRFTVDTVIPGVQVALILLVVPLVTSLQLEPLEMGISGVKDDLGELRAEVQRMDARVDGFASQPPNQTVMAHIEAILKRLDNLEHP